MVIEGFFNLKRSLGSLCVAYVFDPPPTSVIFSGLSSCPSMSFKARGGVEERVLCRPTLGRVLFTPVLGWKDSALAAAELWDLVREQMDLDGVDCETGCGLLVPNFELELL